MKEREKVLVNGETLTIDDVVSVSKGKGVTLPAENNFWDKIDRARSFLLDYIKTGVPTYGVTTDFGDSCGNQISVDKAGELQRVIVRYHGIGMGKPFSREEGRAIILCRLNSNCKGGFSAVRGELLKMMESLLNHDIVPVIPELGSVGASGDLTPLSYLAAVIMGDRTVYYKDKICSAAEALKNEGLPPLPLEAKEGLALMNGTSVMTAVAALCIKKCERLGNISDYLTAVTAEILRGKDTPFVDTTNRIKNHAGQIESGARIYSTIKESKRVYKYEDFLNKEIKRLDGTFIRQQVKIQDRYSIRCAPQVTGVFRDTLNFSKLLVTEELNSVNDNPLVDVEGGRLLNTGNFYGGHICASCDYLRIALANLSDLSDKQAEIIIDGKFNGLTDNLIPRIKDGDPTAGLHLGFKGAQITISALRAEIMTHCQPVSVVSSPTEALNQDKVSLGTISARALRDQIDLLFMQDAIHLLAAIQAVDLSSKWMGGDGDLGDFSPLTQKVYAAIRAITPYVESDRALDEDAKKVCEWLKTTDLFN